MSETASKWATAEAGRELDAAVTTPTGTTVETVREVVTPWATIPAGTRYTVVGRCTGNGGSRYILEPVGGGERRAMLVGLVREVRP